MIARSMQRPAGTITRQAGLTAAVMAWLLLAAVAWHLLFRHAYYPSKTPRPEESRISVQTSNCYRVLLFAHPLCPCTRATLMELDESLARIPAKTSIKIVFETAGLNPEEVSNSALVHFVKERQRIEVQFDAQGRESRRFGATVSGEVLAFDPAGRLRFRGGLTPGRGHQGDATGQAQFERIVSGSSTDFCCAPVYGCRLPIGQ